MHSVVSGDGLPDLGIISAAGKARGYNAMFITDHQAGSNFPISTVVANHVVFEDDLGTKWVKDSFGSPSTQVTELVTSPVKSGVNSLHVKTAAATSGEAFVRLKRGPNLRSGDLILRFSAYPTRIDAGSGMYVSVSIGGDRSEGVLEGYTTRAGLISPGKTNVLVWQLGAARTPSADPNARVIANTLPYSLNAWNDYEINVTTGAVKRNGTTVSSGGGGIASIPAADQPLDYNAVAVMKMAAAASGGGTAEGYFDSYNLDASAPTPSGGEFVYRNGDLRRFDTSSFKLFPSIEMGFNRHAQRFNFDIAGVDDYNAFFQCDAFGDHCRITRGIDGILPTQQTGYPAQLNHPNLPGGVKADEMVADGYNAFGADAMEVREDSGGVPPTTMIDLWDEVLKRGRVLIGTWSSDMHKVESLDVPDRGVATYLRAPSLDFDQLMRSMFEGRAYLARHSFAGRLVFNLDPSSPEPYPSRYPVQVSDSATSIPVHLAITGGIPAGAHVAWIVNDNVVADDATTGGAYEATKPISLAGAWTYVRAELRPASGAQLAMTEPIFFSDVPDLPPNARLGIEGVDTANGRGYTRIATRGITGSSWSDDAQSVAATVDNPAGAVVRLAMETGTLVPSAVRVSGVPAPEVGTQTALDAAAGSAWLYDADAHRLQLKVLQPAAPVEVQVQFPGQPDTQHPTAPTSLTATAASPTRVDLAWDGATDDRGVAGYRVRRGPCGQGTAIATVGGGAKTYADTALMPGATASYEVEAFDAAGNTSPPSPCATATTPTTAVASFAPVADSYVASNAPATNYGTNPKLRADGSPDIRSYLRFDVSGLQGTITRATLVMTSTSASNSGYDVRQVSDTSWGERFIAYDTAPPLAAGLPLGSSLPFASGATPSVDVTAAVSGNGPVSLALTTANSTALSLSSREAGATAPRLVVETLGGGG